MSADVCKRCGKEGHSGRGCKAPFRKSWRGQPAMVLKLRAADGSGVELTVELDQALYARAAQLQLDAWKRSCEPEAAEAPAKSTPKLTKAQRTILARACASPDGARVKGAGNHAAARKLETLGFGRFGVGVNAEGNHGQFIPNAAGRAALAAEGQS